MSYWDNELDKSKVMVMNEVTLDSIQETIVDRAMLSSNPIEYIKVLDGMEIIIDNEMMDNTVEVYEKWMYEAVKIFGKAD